MSAPRLRRFYCRAMSGWPFGDYVFASNRASARAAFFARHHISPYDISPA